MSGDMSMIGPNALYTAASGKSSAYSLLQWAGIDQANIIDPNDLLGSFARLQNLGNNIGNGAFDAPIPGQNNVMGFNGTYVMGAGVGGGASAGGGQYGATQTSNYIMGLNVTA